MDTDEINAEKDNQEIAERIQFNDIALKEATTLAREILLSFVDVYRLVIPIFDRGCAYKIPLKYYDKFRADNKARFYHEMSRLKKAKFVKKYYDGKNYYLELTPKGKRLIKSYLTQDLEIKKPTKWDKKWRIVIYDIANDKKDRRDILRQKLENLGFLKLQESVYVFPFNCLQEINLLKKMYFLDRNVQYLVVERIETEIDLLSKFFDRGILTKKMMEDNKKY